MSQQILHRDIYRLCRPYLLLRNTNKVVATARRLLAADPTPQTIQQRLKDLRLIVDVSLAPSAFYEPSPEETKLEIIGLRLRGALETLNDQQWIDRLQEERAA
jgi:hypothetical protein